MRQVNKMIKIEPNSNSMREERESILEESAADASVEKMTPAAQFVHSKKNCLRISEITPRVFLAVAPAVSLGCMWGTHSHSHKNPFLSNQFLLLKVK